MIYIYIYLVEILYNCLKTFIRTTNEQCQETNILAHN